MIVNTIDKTKSQMSDNNETSPQQTPPTKPKNRSIKSAESHIALLQARAEKIKKTLADIEQAKQKKEDALKRLQASAATPRSTITHQKVLIGAMLMHEFESNPKLEAQVRARLDTWLTRDRDRAAFGFAPLPATTES
jgi:DNA helicase IV